MSRICLYYLPEPERDRWVYGDRWIRPTVRRLVRGPVRPGGLDKVLINLRLGLNRIGKPYTLNLPFHKLRADDRVAVLGRGRNCLVGYQNPNPIVAGIGLMTHPSEWPSLCTEYPVVKYLQHSTWCDAVYRPWFGERCTVWPVGIDTSTWIPTPTREKTVDFLIYDKIHWDYPARCVDLLNPIRTRLKELAHSFEHLRYGHYTPEDYRAALSRCRAMIFLSAHESQGIACQEAMSADVPVFAWDPGFVQDPERFRWGQPVIPSTSVPYFNQDCGERFRDFNDFDRTLPRFVDRLKSGTYRPREYVLEFLTVEKCARHFLDILEEARSSPSGSVSA